ncbi:MAG: helix-turn-helix domain-containing protein [Cyclobacteriaceae bacterium]
MALDKFKDYGTRPNRFTIYMGEQIRKARLEAGLSQEELAEKIYMRRPTLSDIENGKSEANASTLGLLSFYLKKPLTYFYLPPLYEETVKKDMDELSLEMQMYFEKIYGDELKRLAIELVKQFSEFDPTDLVVNSVELIAGRIEHEEELIQFLKKRSNK